MTNYEKYKEELIKMKLAGLDFAIRKETNELCKCADIRRCSGCKFHIQCNDKKLNWLNEEYKKPKEKKINWEELPKDTLLLVKNHYDNTFIQEYYAGYRTASGRFATYRGGRTSKTTDYSFNYWDEAEIVDKEIKEKYCK